MAEEIIIDENCCVIPRQELCDIVETLPVQYQKACNFHNIFIQPFLNQINCLYDSMESMCNVSDCSKLKGSALTAFGESVGFPRTQCNASCDGGETTILDDELYCRLLKAHLIGKQGATVENLCCALDALFGETGFIISSTGGVTQVSAGRPLDCFELNYINLINRALPKTCGTSIELYDVIDLSEVAGISCGEGCQEFDSDCGAMPLCEPIDCSVIQCECYPLRVVGNDRLQLDFLDQDVCGGQITSVSIGTLKLATSDGSDAYSIVITGNMSVPFCIKLNGLQLSVPAFQSFINVTYAVNDTEYDDLLDCIIESRGREFYVNVCCKDEVDCSGFPLIINCNDLPYLVDIPYSEGVSIAFASTDYDFIDGYIVDLTNGEGGGSSATLEASNEFSNCTLDFEISECLDLPDCSILPSSINCDDLPFTVNVPNATNITVTFNSTDFDYINGHIVDLTSGSGIADTATITASNLHGACSFDINIEPCSTSGNSVTITSDWICNVQPDGKECFVFFMPAETACGGTVNSMNVNIAYSGAGGTVIGGGFSFNGSANPSSVTIGGVTLLAPSFLMTQSQAQQIDANLGDVTFNC